MTRWAACRRATLLIPSGPSEDPEKKHLHIVLNDPFDNGKGDQVLIVSVCSIPSSNIYDPSCSLFPGEHPFINKQSYVAYRFCSLVNPALLEEKVAEGKFVAKPILDEKFFKYVLDGVFDSTETALRFKKFLGAAEGAADAGSGP